MKKEFCTYEQSLALKELGYDETCFSFYNHSSKELYESEGFYYDYKSYHNVELDFVLAPLIQQAFRFFREKYDMVGYVQKFTNGTFDWTVESSIFTSPEYHDNGLYDTYEGAELGCIDHLIEVAKGIDK